MTPEYGHYIYQVPLIFTEDNIPIGDPRLLSGVNVFEQLYLFDKILGETLPLKPIVSKCITQWNLMERLKWLILVMGFTLLSFLMLLIGTLLFKDSHDLLGVRFSAFSRGGGTSIQKKKQSGLFLYGFVFLVCPLNYGMRLFLNTSFLLLEI